MHLQCKCTAVSVIPLALMDWQKKKNVGKVPRKKNEKGGNDIARNGRTIVGNNTTWIRSR